MQIVSQTYLDKMAELVRQPSLMELDFYYPTGVVTYTTEDISKVTETKTAHLIAGELPSITLNMELLNDHGNFDPNSSTGLHDMIVEGIKVIYKFGYRIGVDTVEWINGGEVFTDGELDYDDKSLTVTINAVDYLSKLERPIFFGHGLTSLKNIAQRVIDQTDYPEDNLGNKKIVLSDKLEAFTTAFNISGHRDEAMSAKEWLQIIAHAGGVQMYIDREGYLHLDTLPEEQSPTYHLPLLQQKEYPEHSKMRVPKKLILNINTDFDSPIEVDVGGGGKDMVVDNPYIILKSNAEILRQRIEEKFIPYRNEANISTRGEPALDVLDVITFDSNFGDNIEGTIVESTITFDGTLSGELVLRYIFGGEEPTTVKILGEENFYYPLYQINPTKSSISLECVTDIPSPTYQWSYYSIHNGVWANISGATSKYLTITPIGTYFNNDASVLFKCTISGSRASSVRIAKIHWEKSEFANYRGVIKTTSQFNIDSFITAPEVGDVVLLDNTEDNTPGVVYGETFYYNGVEWISTNRSEMLSLAYKDALELADSSGKSIYTAEVFANLLANQLGGIKTITKLYALSSSCDSFTPIVTPVEWVEEAPSRSQGEFLWTRDLITYLNDSSSYTSPSCVTGDKGDAGESGVSITGVENKYLATSASTDVTVGTSGWTTSIQSLTATKKYLWNYEIISYSSGTPTTTTPVIIGVYGDKGLDGDDGISITGIVDKFLATSDSTGITRSTSGWTTGIQTITATKKYLWKYETISYSEGNDTYTDPIIIGVYGDKGDPAPNLKVQYSVNGTSSWHPVFATGDKYMRTSNDNGVTYSTAMKIVGEDGSDGLDGEDGSYTIFEFSKGTATTAGTTWQDSPFIIGTDEYNWMRKGTVVPPATTVSSWSTPVRVTGDKGEPARVIEVVPSHSSIIRSAREAYKTLQISVTAKVQNIVGIPTWTVSHGDWEHLIIDNTTDHFVILLDATTVEEGTTITATISTASGSYSASTYIDVIVSGGEVPYNFGGVTEIPRFTPEGSLIEGDYFLWVGEDAEYPLSPDGVVKTGEVYEYRNGTWQVSTNQQLYMNLLPEFMDIANTSDDEVIGNAIIKKLATVEAFIHELTTNELTLSQNGSIASSYDDNGVMKRYQKGMIDDNTLPENFGGFLLEASGYMELVRVRARDGAYSGELESTDTEGTLLLTQKYELGRELPVSPKTHYLASDIIPHFPDKASKEVSINEGSYIHAFKPTIVDGKYNLVARTLDNSRTVALPEIKGSSKVVLYNSTPYISKVEYSKNGGAFTEMSRSVGVSVSQGDDIRIRQSYNNPNAFVGLGQTSRYWRGMTTLGNDIYACVRGGDIYKQTNGTGNFVALGQTARNWLGMTTLGNDIYACVREGDIYKQTNGTGNFVALGQTSRYWTGMTTLGNDVYASVYGGDIYKQTNGTGNFVTLGQGTRHWWGMTTLGNDVYACVNGGDIYKQTNGTGNFVALGQAERAWWGMTTLGNDVYASVWNGDIYKQTNGTGNFVALGQAERAWYGMTTLGNDVYACVNNGDIYKQTYNPAHQSTISIALPNTEALVLACTNTPTANGTYDDFNGEVITFDTATSQSEKSVVIKSGGTTLFDSALNLYRTFKSVYDELEGIGTYALDDLQSTFDGTQVGFVVKSQNQLTFLTLAKTVVATIGSTTYTKIDAILYLLGQIRGVKTATLLPETGASVGTAQNPYEEGYFENIVSNTFSGSLIHLLEGGGNNPDEGFSINYDKSKKALIFTYEGD